MFVNLSKLAKRMMTSIIIITLIGIAISAVYYRSWDFLPFLYGGLLGALTSLVKVILLDKAVDKLIQMEANSLNAEVSGGIRKNQFYTNGSVGYNHSDGHRENMNFEQFTGYAKAGYDFTGNWSSFIDLNLSKTLSSNPGTVATPIIDNDADILRGVASASLENEYNNTSGAVKLFYNFGTHKINDGYKTGEQPKPFRFNSDDRMFGVSAYQSYSFFEGNETTAGIDLQRFGGKIGRASCRERV